MNITVQPLMASDKSIKILIGITAIMLLSIWAFNMRKPVNPYAHVPREISTKVPNKLMGIKQPIKENTLITGNIEAKKERQLPTRAMQSGFQSIQPTSWEMEQQQRLQQKQQQQKQQQKQKQKSSVDHSLYDKDYQKKYSKWQQQYGGMEAVPDSIIHAHPDGFTFQITDAYSNRFMPASVALLSRCRPIDGFDMPVGAPNGNGYYIAQIFGNNNHLGEDWNGHGGGNSDFGDPVYAIADGAVYWSKPNKGSWGNIVRIIHNIGTYDKPRYIESFYAHLDELMVGEGQEVLRGQQIGTIGDANGHFPAHLHLEIRKNINTPIGKAYTSDTLGFGYVRPLPYIEKRRPWLWDN